MAAPDDTALKALIDSNIPDANPGLPRRATAAFVRATLKTLVDWVKTGINNNLSTWLRASDNSPGGGNTETVYRTGLTQFKGGIESYSRTPTGQAMAQTAFGVATLQLVGNGNGSPAILEFHVPGAVIHQLGVDIDAVLKFRPYSSTVAYPVIIDKITNSFRLATIAANKKIALYDDTGNDQQFYGFGVNDGKLQYRVDTTSAIHAFYAGTSPVTSQELMRIQGNGNVGIGIAAPTERLHVVGNALIQGEIQAGSLAAPTSVRTYGYFINYFMSALRAFRIGGATTTTGLTLKTTQYVSIEIDGTTYKLALVN